MIVNDDSQTPVPKEGRKEKLSSARSLFAWVMDTISQRNQTNFSQTLSNVTKGDNNNSVLLLPLILCTSMQLFGIMGNSLVIHAISTQRCFQTNYYCLVYHLALSDLLVLLQFTVHTLRYSIPSIPPISSSAICILFSLVASLFYISGALFLVAIGLVRYRGTIHPFKLHFTRKKIRYRVVVTTYLISFLISTGFVMLRKCKFQDDLYVYNVFITVLSFFLTFLTPAVLLPVLYSKIIYQLWIHERSLGNLLEPTNSQISSTNNASSSATQVKQRRFIRTSFVSFVIVVVFTISSAPYEIIWFIAIVRRSEFAGIPFWIIFMKLFGTCTVNPFIYGVTDASLRQNFKRTFRTIIKCCM